MCFSFTESREKYRLVVEMPVRNRKKFQEKNRREFLGRSSQKSSSGDPPYQSIPSRLLVLFSNGFEHSLPRILLFRKERFSAVASHRNKLFSI